MNSSAAPDAGIEELPPEPLPGAAPTGSGGTQPPSATGRPLMEIEPEWPSVAAEDAEPAKTAPRPARRKSRSGSGGVPGSSPITITTPSVLPVLRDLLPLPEPRNLPTGDAVVPQVDAQTPVAPEEIPTSSVSQVDKIVKQLPYGEIVYNAPERMQYGEPTDLELLLSPTESAESLRSQLRDPTNAVSSDAQIGNRMEAQLIGDGFAIEALSPALQAVTSIRATRWRWRVTPTSHGLQELHLSLLAHIDVAGNDAPLVVETKDALIQVEITLAQQLAVFIEPNWQWLWGTVLFPIIGYRWRRQRRMDYDRPRRAAA